MRTLRGARRAQREEGDDEPASAITPISRRTMASTTERWPAAEPPDGLGVLDPARVEHGLRAGEPELLGHERDRHGQQRVEPEQPVGRLEADTASTPATTPARPLPPAPSGRAPRTPRRRDGTSATHHPARVFTPRRERADAAVPSFARIATKYHGGTKLIERSVVLVLPAGLVFLLLGTGVGAAFAVLNGYLGPRRQGARAAIPTSAGCPRRSSRGSASGSAST